MAASPFESTDTYTQYELLAPGSGKFRVTYFVTERREGATLHLNGTRRGSEETDLSASDLASGHEINATLVGGPSLLAEGAADQIGNGDASDPESMFSRIELARKVAPGAEGRVRINKTYEDPLSYFVETDGTVVFKRSLGIFRNSVVLPIGYALASSSVNGEIMQLETGQVKVSFVNWHGYAADVEVRGTPVTAALPLSVAAPGTVEAAYNNTEVLYDLDSAGSGRYTITADVDLHRQDAYLNPFQPASSTPSSQQGKLDVAAILSSAWLDPVQTPEALSITNLDTGEALAVDDEGKIATVANAPYGRLRFSALAEEVTHYHVDRGQELVFSRIFCAPRTTVRAPSCTALSVLSSCGGLNDWCVCFGTPQLND